MPDTTAESAKPIETADKSLKNATTSEAAKEALNGLAQSSDPAQRAQEVSQATSVLVHNGDLPQLLLVFDGNENLGKLGMGDDKINKDDPTEMAQLQSAAETGSFTDVNGNVVHLTQAEQIAVQAVFENFDAIEATGGDGAGDGVISIGDINNAATDATAQEALGTRYADLESVVMAFPGLESGAADPAAFNKLFGKSAVSKTDVETLIRSPEFSKLTEQEQRGVIALYAQYDSIAGRDGDASTITPDEVWGAAGELNINYGGNKDSMAAQQAEIDAYETSSQPATSLDGAAVDTLIRDLVAPTGQGISTFAYLDGMDQNNDGMLSREEIHAIANDPTAMSMVVMMDSASASSVYNSIKTLDENWDQLSGGKDTISITDLAAQSSSYQNDTTADAVAEHAAPADANTMATLLAAGGDYSHQTPQKNLTVDELKKYIEDAPEGSPERATLEYVLQHYDQIKGADGDDSNLTWNDVEIVAASGSSDTSGTGGESNSSGLQPGDTVPLGTGEGTVNSDGSVSYTIGTWTEEDQRETPATLATTVLAMWGVEGPYDPDLITDTIATISAANPNVDIYNFPTGVELTIPGEQPPAQDE